MTGERAVSIETTASRVCALIIYSQNRLLKVLLWASFGLYMYGGPLPASPDGSGGGEREVVREGLRPRRSRWVRQRPPQLLPRRWQQRHHHPASRVIRHASAQDLRHARAGQHVRRRSHALGAGLRRRDVVQKTALPDRQQRHRHGLLRHAPLSHACQILPLPISSYRFKFQSNLVWDSIKSISNFCFQF